MDILMGKPWEHYTKWKKLGTKSQRPYDDTSMKYLEYGIHRKWKGRHQGLEGGVNRELFNGYKDEKNSRDC